MSGCVRQVSVALGPGRLPPAGDWRESVSYSPSAPPFFLQKSKAESEDPVSRPGAPLQSQPPTLCWARCRPWALCGDAPRGSALPAPPSHAVPDAAHSWCRGDVPKRSAKGGPARVSVAPRAGRALTSFVQKLMPVPRRCSRSRLRSRTDSLSEDGSPASVSPCSGQREAQRE